MMPAQETVDEAIEAAAFNLKKKLEKAHLKHKNIGHQNLNTNLAVPFDTKNCLPCQKTKEELESGKMSPIVASPTTSAKFQRRIGVAQRNSTEGKLVREAVRISKVKESLDNLNFFVDITDEK